MKNNPVYIRPPSQSAEPPEGQDTAAWVQESEWRHRFINEVTTDYIFVLDVEPGGRLKLSWASENMALHTGRTQGEILTPESWRTIIHPEDVPRLLSFIESMTTDTEKGELECRSFHKGGDERWVRIFARQKKGADGKPTNIVGAVREFTQQKRMEEQLLRSEQKYRNLYESLTDAFNTTNMDGRFLEFNESYRSMVGYSAEELLTYTYMDLTPEKWHLMEARITREETVARGSSEIYEKEYRRKDGTIIPVEIRTFLIRDDKGNPSGMWAIVRDISERKLAEKALKIALQEKETLLREVHHRVKNNLQTVLTLIQMRKPDIHDPAALGVISELQEQIRTISIIYKELFQSERLSQISMQNYLELIMSYLFQTFVNGKHVRLEVECGDLALDTKWAMPCALIVNELITNALKYAFPDGTIKDPFIRVRMWQEKDVSFLLVADNGIGLPENVDREDPATVGLQLVNLWAKHQMNGSMEIIVAGGTCYTISFATG